VPRLRPRRLAVPAAAFVVSLGVLSALDDGAAPARSEAATRQTLTAQGYRALQRARETAADEQFERADAAFRGVLATSPGDVDALVGLGTLAMSRHDFRGALRYAQTARRREPGVLRSYSVLVDAQIELGRYDEAGRSLQRMVDLRPNLASYARVSFFRELHGDLAGAEAAIRLAISAGGDAAENVAYVQSLLGHVQAVRGRRRAARGAYAEALAGRPDYVPALAGLARLDASGGDLAGALRRQRRVVRLQPIPEHVVTLGELEQLAGNDEKARRHFDDQRRTMSRSGSNEDAGLALLEADHGDVRRAVRVGRRGYALAPSVHSADALGWAYTRAGRPRDGLRWGRRAIRLGSQDPLFLARAGLSAAAAGEPREARRLLRRSVARDPRFSAVWAPRVRAALDRLGDAPDARGRGSA
jgi:tetratricopeptide (TPR) repeat protein